MMMGRYFMATSKYIKSALAGILALLSMTAILFAVAAVLLLANSDFGFDMPVVHVHYKSPVFWVLVVVIFSVGFRWELRRLSKRTQPRRGDIH